MKKYLLFLCGLFISAAAMAQPANDNCADAISFTTDEVVSFTTLMSTTDGVNHLDCFGMNDSIPNDVWYTWLCPADGTYNWTNCGNTDYDSRIAMYADATNCPPTDAELTECNDDGLAADCPVAGSSLSFAATAGVTYTFRVGGFSNNPDSLSTMGGGTFVLTQLPDGPANDFCANAIAVDLGMDQAFSTVNALTDGPDHDPNDPDFGGCWGFGSVTADADIWYTFTPDFTGDVLFSTCDMITFDSRLAVYMPGSACPPLPSDLMMCNDDGAGCSDYTSALFFEVEEGLTYLLRIGGWNGDNGTGTFNLENLVPPPPPENDNCVDATEAIIISEAEAELFEFGVVEGTTIAGTDEADFEFPPCIGNTNGGEFSDVWYKFNSLSNTELEIRFLPVDPESVFLVDLYDECGVQTDPTAVEGTCFQNEAGLAARDTVIGLPAMDEEYYIRVTTRLTSETPGAFFIQIVGDNFISSTGDLVAVDQMSVSPNPVSDIANVDFSLTEGKQLAITMTNNLGERVFQQDAQNFQAGQHRTAIDMANLSAGIYFVSINDGKTSKVEKVVKL